MIAPLPNCRSIVESAAFNALSRSFSIFGLRLQALNVRPQI
jgi:hypothetical protein